MSEVSARFVPSYLKNSAAVLDAADGLASALSSGRDPVSQQADVEIALTEVTDAVNRGSRGLPATLRFSAAGGPGNESPRMSVEQATTVAAADAIVARVLLAAAEATGEVTTPSGPEPLRQALQSARADLEALQGTPAAVLAFAGPSQSRFTSASAEDALVTFKSQAKLALDQILDNSEKSISGLVKKVIERKDEALEALSRSSQLFEAGAEATGLIRKAWEKLRSAFHTIRSILDATPIEELKTRLSEVFGGLSMRSVLERMFGLPRYRAQITGLRLPDTMKLAEVDLRSTEVGDVAERHAKVAANIRSIALIAGVAGSLVGAHFAGPFAPVIIPGVYAVAVAALIVIGMDYAGGGVLTTVKGVGKIVADFQPRSAEAGSR